MQYEKHHIIRFQRWAENSDDDEPGQHLVEEKIYLVPESQYEQFNEQVMVGEYESQDYGSIVNFNTLGKLTGEELKEAYALYIKENTCEIDGCKELADEGLRLDDLRSCRNHYDKAQEME